MKLSCMKYGRDLAAYIDGELPADRAGLVERHVRSCAACSRVVADFRRINALPPPAVIEPSAEFDRVFWTKLVHAREREHADAGEGLWHTLTQSFLGRPAGLAAAAGFALCVLIVSIYLLRPAGTDMQKQAIMAAADLDFYSDLEVIQNSEALENFEIIQALDILEQGGRG